MEQNIAKTETGNFWDKSATITSWVLVPLMMPFYGILLIFGLSILNYVALSSKIFVCGAVLGINVLLPMLAIFILHSFGIVKDMGLNNRNERFIPYALTAICLVGTGFFLMGRNAPLWVSMFFFGGAVGAVINLVVNFWWKISAHSAGIAGLVALLVRLPKVTVMVHDVLPWLIVVVLLAGILGACRVYQHRHTPAQVFAGYGVGFISVFLMMLI